MIYLLITLTLVYLLWRARKLISPIQGKIYFDPSVFFFLSFMVLAFIPQMFIYSMENFEAFYITFAREQTAVTMIATCLFGVSWASAATLFTSPPDQTVALYQRSAGASNNAFFMLIGGFFIASASIALHLFLFRNTGSVSGEILLGIATGNFNWLYENYNNIRYAATKQLFLESGIRGMGTMTATMEFLILAATAVIFHATKKWPRAYRYILRASFISLSMLISLSTGARTKAAYCVVFLIVLTMLASAKNRLRMALQGSALVFGSLILLTALTPKTGEISPFLAVFYRLSANAVNDAAIVEVHNAGEFTFKNSFFGEPQEFEALDRQLTYFFTGNPDLTWYETPTCIARYFVQGGMVGVVINGLLLGLVCRFGSYLLRREQNPVMLLAFFPLLCVINLQLPLTGWFVPSVIAASTLCILFVKFLCFFAGLKGSQAGKHLQQADSYRLAPQSHLR